MPLNIPCTCAEASRSFVAPTGRVPGSVVFFSLISVEVIAIRSESRLRGDGRQLAHHVHHKTPRQLDSPLHFSDASRQHPAYLASARFFVGQKQFTQCRNANTSQRRQRTDSTDKSYHAKRVAFAETIGCKREQRGGVHSPAHGLAVKEALVLRRGF